MEAVESENKQMWAVCFGFCCCSRCLMSELNNVMGCRGDLEPDDTTHLKSREEAGRNNAGKGRWELSWAFVSKEGNERYFWMRICKIGLLIGWGPWETQRSWQSIWSFQMGMWMDDPIHWSGASKRNIIYLNHSSTCVSYREKITKTKFTGKRFGYQRFSKQL